MIAKSLFEKSALQPSNSTQITHFNITSFKAFETNGE